MVEYPISGKAGMKADHIVVDQEAERGHKRTRGLKGWFMVPVRHHP